MTLTNPPLIIIQLLDEMSSKFRNLNENKIRQKEIWPVSKYSVQKWVNDENMMIGTNSLEN